MAVPGTIKNFTDIMAENSMFINENKRNLRIMLPVYLLQLFMIDYYDLTLHAFL